MKTVIYKEIDGYDIVLGFGTPVIDPIETIKKIRPLLSSSDEMKVIEAKKKLITGARAKASASFKAAAEQMRKGNRAKAEQLNIDINVHVEEAEGHEKALKPMVKALDDRRRQLTTDEAVYFEPRAGEVLLSDDEAGALSDKIGASGDHELLTLTGVPVADFRGTVHWSKASDGWSRGEITTLGVDPILGAILDKELSKEHRAEIGLQMEAERIAKLTPAKRTAELDAVINSLATQAATKRSADEIQGMSASKALEASKAWYEEQAAIVAAKYAAS